MHRLLFIAFCLFNGQLIFAQAYTVNGDATDLGNDCYILTPELNNQIGTIWYNEQVNLTEPFDIQFTANFDNNDPAGADGMVFVFQQVSNEVLGLDGGGLGFDGFEPSVGIEFDIWQNGNRSDPTFDHLAILRDGSVDHESPQNLAGPVQASSTSQNIEDSEDHVVRISWNPENQRLVCFFDCELRIETNIDLVNDVFDGDPIVFWGFTGATGGAVAEMVLCLDANILGLPPVYSTCPSDGVELTFSSNGSGEFSWEPAELLDDPFIANPIATVQDTTVFTVTYTDLCGETVTQSTQVNIEVLDINLGQDFNLCPDASQELFLPEQYEYEWSNQNEGNSIVISSPGVYYVDAADGNCIGTDTVEVGLAENVIDLDIDTQNAICGENDGQLIISNIQGTGGPYFFDIGGEAQTDSAFSGLTAGDYILTATSPDECVFTEEFSIGEELLVEAGFTANPITGVAPVEVTITDLSSNRTDVIYFLNDEVIPFLTNFTLAEYGTYELTQLVWNNDPSCRDTAIVTIKLDPFIDIKIPNIITPNSDGFNDDFAVLLQNIDFLEVEIYNRWGKLIHEQNQDVSNLEFASIWSPEDQLSEGVYFYIIRATAVNSQRLVEQGELEVISQ